MTELGTTNFFIDKTKKPKDDQGVIDIGQNCYKCKQLDFLPFNCEFCNHTYCSNHRTLDAHDCSGRAKFNNQQPLSSSSSNSSLPKSSSLFPDRYADKQKLDQQLRESSPKPTNILQSQFRVGDVASKVPNAFAKFNKFLLLQKKKKSSSITKLFASSSSSTSKNKVVEMSLLRKLAKGDAKIPVNDRIYLWSLYIRAKSDEDFSKINVEKDRKAIFISKNWPVGRALDSIADIMAVGNYNNQTNDSQERLNIFKLVEDTPKIVAANERCNKAFANADTLYLVKGSVE